MENEISKKSVEEPQKVPKKIKKGKKSASKETKVDKKDPKSTLSENDRLAVSRIS